MKVIHRKEDDSKFLHYFKEDVIKVLNDNSKYSEIGLVGYTIDSIVQVFKDIKEKVNDRIIYGQAYSFCLTNENRLAYCSSNCLAPMRGRSINYLILFDYNRWTDKAKDEVLKALMPVVGGRPNNEVVVVINDDYPISDDVRKFIE
jgi:hypothetical protein